MTLKRKGRKEKYGGTSEGILIYREPKMVGGGQISKWGLGLGLAKTVLVKPASAVQNLAKNSTILKEKKNSHLQDILLYKK